MYQSERRTAFYKVMPSSNIPHRKGPLQIIRSCQNCVRDARTPLEDGQDEILAFMCYDDLVKRRSIWFSPYRSILYHTGQFEVLRQALFSKRSDEVLFIVALTNPSDMNYLELALKHSISGEIKLKAIALGTQSVGSNVSDNHFEALPLHYQSCPTDASVQELLFGPSRLDSFLEPIMQHADSAIQIVIAVVSKDHDIKEFPGLGTVCVQLLEPFSIQDYKQNAITYHPSTHLAKHIYYNIAQSTAVLPSHLVAFLILYLEREEGVSFEDLTVNIEWFRNSSIDLNLHLGFTGEIEKVVQYGLLVLRSYIHKYRGRYMAKNFKSLAEYANIVAPFITYQGIVARAILVEHNKADLTHVETILRPNVPVRVARDDVVATSKHIAEDLELIMPCRKPCVETETMVNQELSKMQLSGRYITIQEPKINTTHSRTYWAGEEDSDEEYFEMNKNKDAFRTWIQLTSDPQKVDRLNLFINAIGYCANAVVCETE